jgi:PKD repeat protein
LSGGWAGGTSEVISVQDSNASVANFSASPVCGKAPLKVRFRDKSTGSPAEWKWCFGDGTSSKEKNPVHTYCKAGEYNVTLITNSTPGSNKVTKSEYIRVLK